MKASNSKSVSWIIAVVVIATGLWFVSRAFRSGPTHENGETSEAEHDEQQGEHEEEAPSPVRLSRDSEGRRVLSVPKLVQTRIGLAVGALKGGRSNPRLPAYGQLEEDPARAFVLRSPVAGYLRNPRGAAWPQVGDRLAASVAVGEIQPRLSPVEQYDLTARRNQAQAEVEGVKADLAAARSSYENKKQLNENQKVVTDRVLEEAEVKVKSGEARLRSAMETLHLFDDALIKGQDSSARVPLVSGSAGDVVEVFSRPGETVESGQALLRTADFTHLIARVTTPVESPLTSAPIAAHIVLPGSAARTLDGKVVTGAPLAGQAANGLTFLVALEVAETNLRPGMAVVASLELPGEAIDGAVVPRDAVVRYGGSAFIYAQTADEQFTRKPIEMDAPSDDGWFVSKGCLPNDRVVVVGAGTLLSEELRSQIEAEAEGEE